MHKRRRKISIIPYLFVAPVIILLLVFNIAPLFVAFVTSAFDVSTTLSDARFVGFGNYVEVFQDSRFWNSLFVTFKWTIIEVPLQVLVAFFLSALLTKNTMVGDNTRYNAQNTFEELLKLGTVPIVNENDTVSTHEIQFGDNDRLSAIVAALIGADLLILLSDIDGLYSDDPRSNPDARFISFVKEITPDLMEMGKDSTGSDVGTGGMAAKLAAARIATDSGSDMVITNGDNVEAIEEIISGAAIGTLFLAHANLDFDLIDYVNNRY